MLTYIENNSQWEAPNGQYCLDMAGHQVIVEVWPSGYEGTVKPVVTIDLLNGTALEADSSDPEIWREEITDEQDHLLHEVLAFHDEVKDTQDLTAHEHAFLAHLLIPLGNRLAEYMAMGHHEEAAPKVAELNIVVYQREEGGGYGAHVRVSTGGECTSALATRDQVWVDGWHKAYKSLGEAGATSDELLALVKDQLDHLFYEHAPADPA